MSVKLQHQLIARPEIGSIQDLAGKRIGVQRQGDLTAFESRRLVELHRVPDVAIVAVGRDSERLAAVLTGAADATPMAIPWDIKAEQQGLRTLLAIGSVLEIPQAGLATSDEKIARDADEIAGLARSTIRATRFLREPANQEATTALIANWVELPSEDAAAALDRVRDTYSPSGLPTDSQMQLYLDMLRATGAASDDTTVDTVFDFRISRRVAAEMGVGS
jgi:ABC-type nitrate/sulfonate/bicarbonate transport system substrate-binding protein